MTTVIEDSQLTLELQELYCITKGWIADLSALNINLKIQQQRVLEKAVSKKGSGNNEDIADIGFVINDIENRRAKVEGEIEKYLTTLSPLINKSDHNYELTLIEKHALLEYKTSALFYAYIDIKDTISKFLQK